MPFIPFSNPATSYPAQQSGSLFAVQYRCLYREQWYDDLETTDPAQATVRLQELAQAGRRVRVYRDGVLVMST